jgi:hypothetical protein
MCVCALLLHCISCVGYVFVCAHPMSASEQLYVACHSRAHQEFARQALHACARIVCMRVCSYASHALASEVLVCARFMYACELLCVASPARAHLVSVR